MMKVADWLARTVMLVLAALATLALIGSLASVSNSPIGDAFPGAEAETAFTTPPRPPSDPRIVEPGTGVMTVEATPTTPVPPLAPTPQTPAERETVRWLRALTYAVLALAVFAAAGVIALVRVATHLRRIAER